MHSIVCSRQIVYTWKRLSSIKVLQSVGLVNMERHIDAMIARYSEIADHTDKAGKIFEKGDIDTWNASLMRTLSAQMYHSSSSSLHVMDIKTANNKAVSPQVNLANQPLQATICSGAARMIPGTLPPTCPIFSTTAFRGLSLLNKGPLGSGRLSCGGGNLGASASQSLHNEFDVQLSEVCQRRFVMFDDCGSKRRMIFHPAMMNELSALITMSSQAAATYNLEPLTKKGGSGKGTSLFKYPFSACIVPLGGSSPHTEPNRMPSCAARDSLSSASDNCDVSPSAARGNLEVKADINYLDETPDVSCFSHENTEDLEALLSSDDDEVSSTAHSPSDLTRNNSLTVSPSNSEGYSMCNSKRRKREYDAHMDDDTCSTATSGTKTARKDIASEKVASAYSIPDIVKDGLAFQEAALLRSARNNLTALDMFFPDEMSSSSSANNQKWPKELPVYHQQQQQQPPAEQSRKQKIKSILRLLRGIIPGGESMDTAFVLDEAIQYVRTLQSEVQKLQARKLMENSKHQ